MNTGMLTGFNGVQSALRQGFSGVNDAITQSTIADMQSDFGLQTAITGATTALTAQLTGMAADNAAKRQRILEVLAQKQANELQNMSEEELKKMLENL